MSRSIGACKSREKVALISSGDSGIYGMAGIMLEVAMDSEIEVEVIPGITSTIAGAALVGAPLMHDQVLISLSDLLTDWEVIKEDWKQPVRETLSFLYTIRGAKRESIRFKKQERFY